MHACIYYKKKSLLKRQEEEWEQHSSLAKLETSQRAIRSKRLATINYEILLYRGKFK